jgi:hypothetical protein
MRLIVLFVFFALFFGLAFSLLPEIPSHDDDDLPNALHIELNLSCDANLVEVTDGGGDPVSGAHVSVKDTSDAALVASGDTDASGRFSFSGCGRNVDVKATESGYSSATLTTALIGCGQCAECMSDDDCPAEEYCAAGDCLPIPCDCGFIDAHQCIAYECCLDSDCGENGHCGAHACSANTSGGTECSEDADCLDAEYCNIAPGAQNGYCEDVSGCGYASNHTLVPYQCGNDSSCPLCQEGYVCIRNTCVQGNLSCPATAFAGDEVACNATSGDGPCAGCDYLVTDPAGRNSTGTADANGSIRLPLAMAGVYNLTLMANGTPLSALSLSVFPGSGEAGPDTALMSPEALMILGLLLIILLVALAIYFLRPAPKKE